MQTFQHNLPVFVKTPNGFTSAGKFFKQGKHYPWLEMNIPVQKVQEMFNIGHIHHNEQLAAELKSIGDGLDALGKEELEELVRNINQKVKDKTRNESEFKKKKCATSKIPDKQRGLIRRWRSLYGELEND